MHQEELKLNLQNENQIYQNQSIGGWITVTWTGSYSQNMRLFDGFWQQNILKRNFFFFVMFRRANLNFPQQKNV